MKLSTACCLSSLLVLPASAQTIRDSLVAYWPLDAVSVDGTTTPDTVSGSHLTLEAMDASNVVPGKKGNAFTFDGTTELLYRNTGDGLSPGLPFLQNAQRTICFWVKGVGTAQAGGAGDRRIFAEANSTQTTTLFNLGTDNNAAATRSNVLGFYVRGFAADGTTTANPVNHRKTVLQPLDGTWHHIALTESISGTGVSTARIYIDGTLDSSYTTFTYTTPPVNSSDIFALGGIRRYNATTTIQNLAFFLGQVDEVGVWTRVLSQAEIRSIISPAIAVNRPGPYQEGDHLILSAPQDPSVASPSFQWRRNGADIAGANGATYTIPALGAGSDGTYSVLANGSPSTDLVIAYTPDPAAAVTTNLVSWWPGESIDTAAFPVTTPDPWGGHPLTCTDMDSANLVPGKFGTAFDFDGLTEIAIRTTGFPIAGNPEYSVSLWVKADGTIQSDLRFFAEGSNLANNQLFGLGTPTNGSDKMRIYLRSDTGTVLVNADSAKTVLDDQWHHVVWTDRNGTVRLYVDGEMDSTVLNYNRTGQTFTLNQTSLGAIQRAATSHWCKSQLDDVAVWNRALNWTEVKSLMLSGVPAPVAAVPPDVTVQPNPKTLYQGRSITFSIQATGTAPLSVQWLKNGNPIQDATDFAFTIPLTVPGDSGSYSCRVTNSAGSDTSDAVALNVLPITGLNTGLLSCYPLDSGNPDTVDTIGGQNLTLFNLDPLAAYSSGVRGNAINFDGVDDIAIHTRTNTGNDLPLTSREEFTVSFWVRGTGIGQLDRRIFSESFTGNANTLFNLGTDDLGAHEMLEFFIRGDTGAVPVNHTTSFLPVFDGNWHHVLYTDYLGQGQLYVDGQQDVGLTYTRPAATFNTVTLGGIQRAAASHWFAGSADQLCTWGRALTPEEALTVYQFTSGNALRVGDVTPLAGNRLRLNVLTELGARTYRIESTADVAAGPWEPVTGATISAVAGGAFTAEFSLPAAGPRLFYRAVTDW